MTETAPSTRLPVSIQLAGGPTGLTSGCGVIAAGERTTL